MLTGVSTSKSSKDANFDNICIDLWVPFVMGGTTAQKSCDLEKIISSTKETYSQVI